MATLLFGGRRVSDHSRMYFCIANVRRLGNFGKVVVVAAEQVGCIRPLQWGTSVATTLSGTDDRTDQLVKGAELCPLIYLSLETSHLAGLDGGSFSPNRF